MLIQNALIVDDSKSARIVLQRLLTRLQVNVDMVESAEDALIFLEHQQPDVIFMDHMMPGMDGLQATQLIRENPKTSRIPTIMYTSKDGEDYSQIAAKNGASGVLCKPANQEAVNAVIRSLDKPAANDAKEGRSAADSKNIPLIEIDHLVQKHLRTALTEAKSEIVAGIDLTTSQLQQHQKHQLEVIRRELQRQVTEVQNNLNTELDSERLFKRTRALNQKLATLVSDRITARSRDELSSKLQTQKADFNALLEEHKKETDKRIRGMAIRALIASAAVGMITSTVVLFTIT